MGYSCTAIADLTLQHMLTQLQAASGVEQNTSNSWVKNGERYYFEYPTKERPDGAITGSVYRFLPGNRVKRVGSARIEPNGEITRFPTSNKVQRDTAMLVADAEFERKFGKGLVQIV